MFYRRVKGLFWRVGTVYVFRPKLPSFNNVIILFIMVFIFGPPNTVKVWSNRFVGLSPQEMVNISGYPIEIHNVKTDDGFILGLHRIPYGKNTNGGGSSLDNNKTAVLLVHGLGGSPADYLGMGPNRSLGFILADAGYDVWLGNTRGTKWSKNHTLYDPKKDADKYWDFSYDELGLYDNPAIIDYILNFKNQTQLIYIGHSQGTTSFIVMASAKPEYNKKIKLAILMAPVVAWKNITMDSQPLFKVGYFYKPITSLLDFVGQYQIPFTDYIRKTYPNLCSDPQLEETCKYFLSGSTKEEIDLLEPSLLPVIYTNSPSDMSWKEVKHFGQRLLNPAFDYGEEQNMVKYGSKYPPSYNLSLVTAPLALFYANNDTYVTTNVRQYLNATFPNIVGDYVVPRRTFYHYNFVWANNAKALVYDEILKYLKNY